MGKIVMFFLFSFVSAIHCNVLPSVTNVILPYTAAALANLVAHYTAINANLTNGIAHAICEKTGSHILCDRISGGHKIITNLPAAINIKHCNFLAVTPHCCAAFCQPGNGGTCDSETGACFCNPTGVPKVCNLIMKTEYNPTPALLFDNDNAVLDACAKKCAKNTNGCTKPAATTDGVTGMVCMCYCSPNGDGAETTTPTPEAALPTF